MLSDKELEVVATMCDLIKVVTDAAKDGFIHRVDAEEHIGMYAREIAGVLQPHKAPQVAEQ